LTKKKVAELIDAVFSELGNHLVKQRMTKNGAPKFTYPGFGTFTKKKRKALEGRFFPPFMTMLFNAGACRSCP
jgi:nucleoid DNA-binding protein